MPLTSSKTSTITTPLHPMPHESPMTGETLLEGGGCQSTTLHTELHTSLGISKALPHTLTHCIVDSADCTITVLPPVSTPPHMLSLVCLFICLPLSLAHMLPSLFVYFPFLLFLILAGSRPTLSPTAPIV